MICLPGILNFWAAKSWDFPGGLSGLVAIKTTGKNCWVHLDVFIMFGTRRPVPLTVIGKPHPSPEKKKLQNGVLTVLSVEYPLGNESISHPKGKFGKSSRRGYVIVPGNCLFLGLNFHSKSPEAKGTQPPQYHPPQEIRPYSGTMNRWFPLTRPYDMTKVASNPTTSQTSDGRVRSVQWSTQVSGWEAPGKPAAFWIAAGVKYTKNREKKEGDTKKQQSFNDGNILENQSPFDFKTRFFSKICQ